MKKMDKKSDGEDELSGCSDKDKDTMVGSQNSGNTCSCLLHTERMAEKTLCKRPEM